MNAESFIKSQSLQLQFKTPQLKRIILSNPILPKKRNNLTEKSLNQYSAFQILRPIGDFDLPCDREYSGTISELDKKYEFYSNFFQPLEAKNIYSQNTLRLKVEMDILMNQYIDSQSL